MQNSKMNLDFWFRSWTHCRVLGLIICNFPNTTLTKLYWSISLSFCRARLRYAYLRPAIQYLYKNACQIIDYTQGLMYFTESRFGFVLIEPNFVSPSHKFKTRYAWKHHVYVRLTTEVNKYRSNLRPTLLITILDISSKIIGSCSGKRCHSNYPSIDESADIDFWF